MFLKIARKATIDLFLIFLLTGYLSFIQVKILIHIIMPGLFIDSMESHIFCSRISQILKSTCSESRVVVLE